jgi:hypothetical protein
MKTLKHITLLAAALFFAASAYAQTQLGTSNTYYELTGAPTNLTLNITGTGNMPNFTSSTGTSPVPWYPQRADIKTLVIANGVNSIGWYAFEGCTGLTSVTVPGSVGSIGYYAFRYCSALTSITVPDGVLSIGNQAFRGSGLTSVDIPGSVTTIGNFAFRSCTGLTAINVNAANQNYLSENGVLFNKDTTTLICCPAGKTGAYAIPNGVDSIVNNAFRGCSGLTGALTIPSSVKEIGDYAFYNCSRLTGALTIPSSVTYIGQYAFGSCTGFTAIYNYCIAPLNIFYFDDVFYLGVDKSTCVLYVPCGTAAAYSIAGGWKDFSIISETLPNPLNNKIIDADIYYGGSYTDNGFNLINQKASGTHTLNLTASNGCDSIVTLNLTVNPLPITISPNSSQSKIYGNPDLPLTFTCIPALLGSDTCTGALARAAGDTVGTYDIYQGNLSAGSNYSITFTTGKTFEITPATPAVTFPSAENIYCGSTLADAVLTGGAGAGSFAWEYPDSVLATGSYNYNLIFTPSNPNYATVTQAVSVTVDDLPSAVINCEICYGTSYSDDIFTTPISEAGTYTATETLPSGCQREVKLNLTVVKNPMQEVLDKLNEKIEDIKATLKAVKARRP